MGKTKRHESEDDSSDDSSADSSSTASSTYERKAKRRRHEESSDESGSDGSSPSDSESDSDDSSSRRRKDKKSKKKKEKKSKKDKKKDKKSKEKKSKKDKKDKKEKKEKKPAFNPIQAATVVAPTAIGGASTSQGGGMAGETAVVVQSLDRTYRMLGGGGVDIKTLPKGLAQELAAPLLPAPVPGAAAPDTGAEEWKRLRDAGAAQLKADAARAELLAKAVEADEAAEAARGPDDGDADFFARTAAGAGTDDAFDAFFADIEAAAAVATDDAAAGLLAPPVALAGARWEMPAAPEPSVLPTPEVTAGAPTTESADAAAPVQTAADLLLALAGRAAAAAPVVAPAAPELPAPADDAEFPEAVIRGGAKTREREDAKVLAPVDHSQIAYPPIQKDFYMPPSDVARLSAAEIEALCLELDGGQVRGENPPPPLRDFESCGLNDESVNVLKRRNFLQPFAVQSLAMPILMSGRDAVITAKTGSGKTLSYLLPMIRHVRAQPRAARRQGPVGLILVPTHELAAQVAGVAAEFFEANNIRCLNAFGGVAVRDNVEKLHAGCDICIATPGRLFALAAKEASAYVTQRISFVVLDEADRLFDEGLGAQVLPLLQRTRPDRQVAFISSTMPVEVKKLLHQHKLLAEDALQVRVGGRPNPSTNVTQTIEFFDPPGVAEELATDAAAPAGDAVTTLNDRRYARLVETLRDHDQEHQRTGHRKLVMVFVRSHHVCDALFLHLTRSGYAGRVGALNATMDALDREAALVQFTRDDRPILITTAVAERGVDVAGLDLVVNFDVPDHFEAYVNRIGRTGRAGQKGTAVTYFVRGPDDESAAMLVSALSGSHQFVPDDLRMVAEQYKEKIKQGLVRRSNGFRRGFGCGHGFTFTKADRPKQLMLTAGPGEAAGNAEDDEDATVYSRRPGDPEIKIVSRDDADRATGGKLGASGALVLRQPTAGGAAGPAAPARLTAAEVAAELTRRRQEEESGAVGVLRQAEFPINDLNERIRRRLTSRRVLEEVGNATETSITVNGRYVDEASRRLLQPGERSLFLLVHGQREAAVAQACRRLQAMVDEEKKRHAEAARLYSK